MMVAEPICLTSRQSFLRNDWPTAIVSLGAFCSMAFREPVRRRGEKCLGSEHGWTANGEDDDQP